MECFALSDGGRLPKIGFGTYRTTGEEGVRAIRAAIEAGYRFFDTASLYETERQLARAIRESGVPQEEFIVETKLWTDEMGAAGARAALERSLRRLGTDCVDLYLIHWPRRTGAWDEDWKALDLETWGEMEKLRDEGKVRRLGLSNFLPHHLENILANCRVRPVVDQLELHPGYSQEAAVAYCRAHGVLPMAWSPLAHGDRRGDVSAVLSHLAEKYGRSEQQIALRFLLEKGVLPIPKAMSEAHIRGNLRVFDFSLEPDEVSMISCMQQTAWRGEHPDFAIPRKKSNPDNV